MKYQIVLFFILTFSLPMSSFSQEKREVDNSKNRELSDIYQYSQEVTSFLQISQIEDLSSPVSLQNNQNIAIIQQVGLSNSVSTQTNSLSSDFRYLQVGLRNSIESINSIENASERVIQIGADNSLFHNAFGNISTSNLDVIQTGTNLELQKIGSNAQTNGMAFRMFGQDRTIIVRSN